MELVSLLLPSNNQFATEYSAKESPIQQQFHYRYTERESYKDRVKDVLTKDYRREELCDYISTYMMKFGQSEAVSHSIEKLRQPGSVVVIGGQQAGLLTGPLYSIHKIISIIALAKKKEQELQVPVVPVFWIAGEDHDYDEVNHLFTERNGLLQKKVYPEKLHDKRMISDAVFSKEIMRDWVLGVVASFGETEHTNPLLTFTEEVIEKSDTFVDFFAQLVMKMFAEYGLLLVDSGDRGIRKLEKDFFIELIEQADQLTAQVKSQQASLRQLGFSEAISISETSANLFYYDEDLFERILLEYDSDQQVFTGKDGTVSFSKSELLTIANEFPHKLSNNVVTRPLMQEWLFPTLAFVAGPGEIAYWAELKGAFELMNMKMPPIVPRLNITIVERNIASDLADLSVPIEMVLEAGTKNIIEEYVGLHRDSEYADIFASLKDTITDKYDSLEIKVSHDYAGMLGLLQKNEQLILKQLEFLETRLELALREKHGYVIERYERMERHLKPNGSPQERVWNMYYYLNGFGFRFVHELLQFPYEFDGKHQVIYI